MQGGHGVRSIHCGCSTIWGYVCVCMSHSQHHTPKSSCPPDLTTVAMQAPLPWLVTPTRSFEFVATGDLPRQQLQQARHAAWTTLLYSAPLANWYVPRAKQKSQKIALTLYICLQLATNPCRTDSTVLTMGWTAREDLVVLYASGHVDIYNIRGDLLPTSFQLIVDAARMGKDTVLRTQPVGRGGSIRHTLH